MEIKISMGEEFTIDEVNKYGAINFKIANMPRIGERIFLSDSQLTAASNIMRNRLRSGYNYVNATIYGSDGIPIVMLNKKPKHRVFVESDSHLDVYVGNTVDVSASIDGVVPVEIKEVSTRDCISVEIKEVSTRDCVSVDVKKVSTRDVIPVNIEEFAGERKNTIPVYIDDVNSSSYSLPVVIR